MFSIALGKVGMKDGEVMREVKGEGSAEGMKGETCGERRGVRGKGRKEEEGYEKRII